MDHLLDNVFNQPDSHRIEKYNAMLKHMITIDVNGEMYLKWWQFKKKRELLKKNQETLFKLHTIFFSLWFPMYGTNPKGRIIFYRNTPHQASVRSGK